MPRAKKDGAYLNCYSGRELRGRLDAYAEEKGQTITTALERILKQRVDEYDKNIGTEKSVPNHIGLRRYTKD